MLSYVSVSVGSKAPLDLSLAVIIFDDPVGQPSSYIHSGSTSSDVGDHEVCLDDPVVHFGILDASWFGVTVDLSE